eukprot:TRINITY_DN6022_c0_g1_i2.p1 TRINITY_DN6022_c0_g1~~TRINITY_DN6022_c0_g1_i2.p1  ORF type:complete len:131 (-),score=16.43 TRINITY_DN6022_c0_g1_i2:56-406(-)
MAHQLRPTLISKSFAEASARSLQLYKSVLRAVPSLMVSYDLEYPASVLKKRLRHEFEKNRNVRDIPTIDMLVFRGSNELEESVQVWKTRSHVEKYFAPPPPKEKTWLEKFYSGEER